MPRPAARDAYSPRIGWTTLLAYERALRQSTRGTPPHLSFAAFAGLSALDVSALPPVRFVSAADGQKLGFRLYDADSNNSLVLLHGSGCFGDQLHALASRVAEAGAARVYTLNARGHGLSGGERGHAVTRPEQIVADVGEFLQDVKAQRPANRIILGGHSAGGGVVLGVSRTAARELISGYVFLAPYLGAGSPTIRPHFGGWVKVRKPEMRAITLMNLLGVTRFNDRTVLDFNMEACLHHPRFVKNWSYNTALAFGPGRWIPDAAPIPADRPVLLLAGENDQCFTQPLYREALRVIAPHAEMPKVGASGHWDLLVDPKTIAPLCGWLEGKFPNIVGAQRTQDQRGQAAA